MRIIGYARVSKREQSYTHALEQQIKRLRDYGVSEVISDVESGRSDDRSGFNRLTELITQGNLTIIATRIDRLSRSIISLKSFFSLCDRHDVKVVTLDDAIDTSTAAGKFHLNMLGALAEMESDRISERVLHGHAYHCQRGAVYYPVFGYLKQNEKFYIDCSPFLYCEGREWETA